MDRSQLIAERKHLSVLIKEHKGCLSAMARASSGSSRQVLTRRLAAHGLLGKCTQERARHGVTGPRLGSWSDTKERDRVVRALERSSGYRSAAERLGVSPRTMMRKMRSLGIDAEQIARAR